MKYKINIRPYDSERVLVYDSYGLDSDTINQVNDKALKEEWRDISFATLDDNRVGIVCKPETFVKIMGWRDKKYGKKYPVNLKKEFIRSAKEALELGEQTEYKEELSQADKELKKYIEEAVQEHRENEEEDETEGTWEQEDKE